MSNIINAPVLVTTIQDLARGIKSEADLSSLTRELLKITVEASLNAEMEAHLGYSKHSPAGHNSGKQHWYFALPIIGIFFYGAFLSIIGLTGNANTCKRT